jgi:hypothetical protein
VAKTVSSRQKPSIRKDAANGAPGGSCSNRIDFRAQYSERR